MRSDSDHENDPEIARVTGELARARDKLDLSMSALEDEITRTFDWHEWVRRKPGMALALAFGLGFFLGRRR